MWTPVSPGWLCPWVKKRGPPPHPQGHSASQRRKIHITVKTYHKKTKLPPKKKKNHHRMIMCWLNPALSSFFLSVLQGTALADRFNSNCIWIQDINRVITWGMKNPFKGCLWILRARQIKRPKPCKTKLVNPLRLFSFCEWSSFSEMHLQAKQVTPCHKLNCKRDLGFL